MPNRNVGADGGRLAGIGVDDGIILNVGIFADGYPVIIAAQHRAEPHACVFQQSHTADQ